MQEPEKCENKEEKFLHETLNKTEARYQCPNDRYVKFNARVEGTEKVVLRKPKRHCEGLVEDVCHYEHCWTLVEELL